jgi:hypothetical protein
MRTSIAAILAATLFSSPAFTQQQRQSTEAVPDFSGIWGHPYLFPGFEQPPSGRGPLVNKYQRKQLNDRDRVRGRQQ